MMEPRGSSQRDCVKYRREAHVDGDMTPSPCAAGDTTRRIVRPETRRDERKGRRKTGTPRPPGLPIRFGATCCIQHLYVPTRPAAHNTLPVCLDETSTSTSRDTRRLRAFRRARCPASRRKGADYKNGACGRSSSARSVAFVQHTRLLQCGTSNANAAHRPLRSGPALTTISRVVEA